MLSEVSPEQFDEWIAYKRIKHDPLEVIREVLKLGFAVSTGLSPDKFDPTVNAEKASEVSGKTAVAIMKAEFGAQ